MIKLPTLSTQRRRPAGTPPLLRALSLPLCLSLAVGCLGPANQPAEAKPTVVEWLQYLSPLPEKGYLNESQDRLIKKKSFKLQDMPDAEPVANKETGLFALVPPARTADLPYLSELLARKEVNGLSVLLTWRQLEPEDDQYNWKPIDDLLCLCAKYNKTLILRISTCGLDLPGSSAENVSQAAEPGAQEAAAKANSDTPKWLFEANVKAMPYTGADGKTHLMPIFWDTDYLANWSNFIQDLAERYDKSPYIHSIGITGGGIRGGTAVVPSFAAESPSQPAGASASGSVRAYYAQLERTLKQDYGMTPRQLVEHWKYAADLFPKAFTTARLNFDIDPPTPNRAGQDALDEISDYLAYRYGERVYLTRQSIADAKHGFDEYRVLLKFRPDTLTGYQLSPGVNPASLPKIVQNALDDGISFAEVPADILTSSDEVINNSLKHLASHIGYQVISQAASIPAELPSGAPLPASFTFVNLGAAAPMRPDRNFDKDVAASYKIALELRDASGKPVVVSLHTPELPTNRWPAGKPVQWQRELKLPELPPGEYSVWMSLVDPGSNRKLQFLNAISEKDPLSISSAPVGKIKITAATRALGAKDPAPASD